MPLQSPLVYTRSLTYSRLCVSFLPLAFPQKNALLLQKQRVFSTGLRGTGYIIVFLLTFLLYHTDFYDILPGNIRS